MEKIQDKLINGLDKSLFKVGTDPITTKSLLLGLIFLVIGFYLSKILSKKISSKLKARNSTKRVVESILFYTFLLFAVIFSFKFAKLPITIFTLFGGALAVGVGFGSKNLINNFISGIILMIERPIKVDDFVEINNTFGFVENIGSRSTLIKTFGNKHIVVPNSFLLENSFINWTLKNRTAAFDLSVGVMYGSDLDKVNATLRSCAENCKSVLSNPAPQVFFSNFGESALEYKLRYSITLVGIMDRLNIESELRTTIAKEFAKNNLIIAFPQRDINFKQSEPIQFKVIKDE